MATYTCPRLPVTSMLNPRREQNSPNNRGPARSNGLLQPTGHNKADRTKMMGTRASTNKANGGYTKNNGTHKPTRRLLLPNLTRSTEGGQIIVTASRWPRRR